MTQKHLFVLDPLARLNFPLDSSLRMAIELTRLGHQTYFTEARLLSWRNGDMSAQATVRAMSFPAADPALTQLGPDRTIPLTEFSGIHMRKDPPFNMEYVATTWLLETAGRATWIFNHPAALRSINEKLAIFHFPEESAPGLVSTDPHELLAFHLAQGCDSIVKPLDLFGGRGVYRLTMTSSQNRDALESLRDATADGTLPRLIQKFDQQIFHGEVRAFSVGGKTISWCLKVPPPGKYLANTAQGAVLKTYKPSVGLEQKINRVAEKLCDLGIFLCGFDIIGENISEINITSPRLLQGADDPTNYYQMIAEWFSAKCENRPWQQV